MEIGNEEIKKIIKKDKELFEEKENSNIEGTLIMLTATLIVFISIYIIGYEKFMSIFY